MLLQTKLKTGITSHFNFPLPARLSLHHRFDNQLKRGPFKMNISENLARVEHVSGRVFNTKLIGIEALNADRQPVYYDQQFYDLRRNDDLAIIGDKAIDLVLSIMWYRSRDLQSPIVEWYPSRVSC